jgi:hypothetical protein
MNNKELKLLVRQIIKETFEKVEEGSKSHGDAKELNKAIKWIKKNLKGVTVEDIKSGYRICPPKEFSDECYSTHRGGKDRFDLYRFLSKAYDVNKHEIENAISANRALNLLAIKTKEKNSVVKNDN